MNLRRVILLPVGLLILAELGARLYERTQMSPAANRLPNLENEMALFEPNLTAPAHIGCGPVPIAKFRSGR